MGKQLENRALTREALLTAFWTLYRQKRIEKITIKDITQLAGYNRGTFYDHFTDIYDALEQLQNSLLDDFRKAIEQARSRNPNQGLIEYIEYVAYTTLMKNDYFRVFLGENRDPNFPDKMKAILRPAFFEVWGITEEDENADLIFEFAISALIGALCYRFKNEEKISYEKFVPTIRALMTNGVFTELLKMSRHPDLLMSLKE